jgi:ribosomal protein S18 acetylase RimI-like enzyme
MELSPPSVRHRPAVRGWAVRAASVQDAQALAALAASTFALACPPGMDPAAIDRHLRERLSPDAFAIALADPQQHLFVAQPPGAGVAGYVRLVADGPGAPEPGLLELRQIYVLGRYHGTGMAGELMAKAVDVAGLLGRAGLWLGTAKQNARAISFYRRHGFAVAGERIFHVGGAPNEDWVLVRRLS